ncbi:MAG: oligosaccharide flippase family protein [Actinomycetota bacterium]
MTRGQRDDVATVARGGAIQIVGQITQRGLAYGFTIVAFRIFDPLLFGLYRQAVQILTIGAQLGLAGYNYAAMRWVARSRAAGLHGGVRGAARVGLTCAAVASALVVVLILVLAEPIASIFGDNPSEVEDLAWLLRVGVAYVPLFAMMQVLRYCTQGYKTMGPSVIAGNIVQPAARFVIGVSVLLIGYFVLDSSRRGLLVAMIVTLSISAALGMITAGWYLRRMMTDQERSAARVSEFGPMTRFALPQAGASLLGIQSIGLGILVLGAFGSSRDVGLFAIALSLQGPGTVFLSGIVNIWAPVVSDLHEKGEIERLGSLYQTINRWIATFSFPVFAALFIVPELFVRVLAGPEGQGSEVIVAILVIGNLFYTGTGPTGYVISMTGRPGINFMNSIGSVALYLALGAWLVPLYGESGRAGVGMAIVDVIVTALINTIRVIQAKVLVGIQPFGRTFYKPVVATLAGAAVLLGWKLAFGTSIPSELAGLVFGAAAFLVALKIMGLDAEERMVINRVRKRTLKGRKKG